MENITQFFIEQGLLGALLVVLGVAYYRKDQQVQTQSREMIEMAREVTRAVIAVEGVAKILERNNG